VLAPLVLAVSLGACGPRSMQARIASGEKKSERASALLDEAERAMNALEPDLAEARIKEAEDLLLDKDVELYPEGDLLRARLTEARGRLAQCREERSRQGLQREVQRHREEVDRALADLRSALPELDRKDAGRAQIDHVRDAGRRVEQRVEGGKGFEAKDPAYAEHAHQALKEVEAARGRTAVVEKMLEFIAGPMKERTDAVAMAERAKAERNLEKRLGLYTQARQRFSGCTDNGQKLIDETPGLEKVSIELDGKPVSIKAVTAGCQARVDGLDRTLEKLLTAQATVSKKAERKAKGKKRR
jgi:hypothetical protein